MGQNSQEYGHIVRYLLYSWLGSSLITAIFRGCRLVSALLQLM